MVVLLEFGLCLGTSSVDQEVPHLLETVLKETGHGETVSVGTAVPGTDSQNYLMLSGIVADSIPIFNHCSEAEEYVVVGYRYLYTSIIQYIEHTSTIQVCVCVPMRRPYLTG